MRPNSPILTKKARTVMKFMGRRHDIGDAFRPMPAAYGLDIALFHTRDEQSVGSLPSKPIATTVDLSDLKAQKKASARTRTEDLRITNAPLYQLSYTGKWIANANVNRFSHAK